MWYSFSYMKERNLATARKLSSLALRERRKGVLHRLPNLQQVLRGSLMERYLTCGKGQCKCARGEKHGPVWYLSVTLKPGKTAGMQVPPEKLAQVREWLENYRKLKEGVETISELNWELLRRER